VSKKDVKLSVNDKILRAQTNRCSLEEQHRVKGIEF